jgi:hypothetical protein
MCLWKLWTNEGSEAICKINVIAEPTSPNIVPVVDRRDGEGLLFGHEDSHGDASINYHLSAARSSTSCTRICEFIYE